MQAPFIKILKNERQFQRRQSVWQVCKALGELRVLRLLLRLVSKIEVVAKAHWSMGYGPWLPNLSQVVDVSADGNYVKDNHRLSPTNYIYKDPATDG